MSAEQAYDKFKEIRFEENAGHPFCPACGGISVGEIHTRKLFKCQDCHKQFSVTSGTILASRKLSFKKILRVIALFSMNAKGHSALKVCHDIGVQYKTAFVLVHKIREAMGIGQDQSNIGGEVEIDGAFYGGYVKPPNNKRVKFDKKNARAETGKSRCMVVIRQRGGVTVPVITMDEPEGVAEVLKRVRRDAEIALDTAPWWSALRMHYPKMSQVNHSRWHYSPWANTNNAEGFHARVHRSERGIYHHFAGAYFTGYSRELAWREDRRRTSNGDKFKEVLFSVTHHPISRRWKGYWQRIKGSKPLPYS